MATLYQRPEGTYESASTSVNASKYRNDSIAKTAIASNKVDGDLNYMIDAVNQLGVDIDDVVSGGVPDGSITTIKIADDAVTNDKIATSAVGTAELIDGSITNVKMASSSINSAQLIDESVTNAKIANAQVTTDKIADGAITEDKLAGDIIPSVLGAGYIKDTITWDNTSEISWYGLCVADDNQTEIEVTSSNAVTATLAVGVANTIYHVYIGYNGASIPSIVAEFCEDIDGSDLSVITGVKRRVLSIYTDGSGNILDFTQFGNGNLIKISYASQQTIYNGSGAVTLRNALVPSDAIGMGVTARAFNSTAVVNDVTGSSFRIYQTTGSAPVITNAEIEITNGQVHCGSASGTVQVYAQNYTIER